MLKNLETEEKGLVREVDRQKGFEVMLAQIPCVFEFIPYKYKLKPKKKETGTPDKNKDLITDSELDTTPFFDEVARKIESLPRAPPHDQRAIDNKVDDDQSYSSC